MKASRVSCFFCISVGILQLVISAYLLAEGYSVAFVNFLFSGSIAVVVGASALQLERMSRSKCGFKAKEDKRIDAAVVFLTLATGIFTMFVAFYVSTLGYGST